MIKSEQNVVNMGNVAHVMKTMKPKSPYGNQSSKSREQTTSGSTSGINQVQSRSNFSASMYSKQSSVKISHLKAGSMSTNHINIGSMKKKLRSAIQKPQVHTYENVDDCFSTPFLIKDQLESSNQ